MKELVRIRNGDDSVWHQPRRLGHGEEILNLEVYILRTGTVY